MAAGAAGGAALGSVAPGIGTVLGAGMGAGAVALAEPVSQLVSMAGEYLTKFDIPTVTEAFNDLLTRLGVAEPRTEAERIVQAAASGVGGAAGMVKAGEAALAGAAAPALKGLPAFAEGAAQQVAGGATGGAAAQLAAESGAGAVGQLAAGIGGGALGAGAAGLRASKAGPVPSAIAAGERAGIPVMTSDIRQPKSGLAKLGQVAGESIPFAGTGGVRAAQQESRIQAVKNILSEYGATNAQDIPEKIFNDLTGKRQEALNLYATMKNEVIDRLDQLKPNAPVPVGRAKAELDRQISSLRSLKTEGANSAIGVFEDFKQAIDGQGLRNIEELRKNLGEAFKAPELTSSRTLAEKGIARVYGALREDMGDFIRSNGERRDVTKWGVANKRLSVLASEVDDSALKSILDKGEKVPEAVDRMLLSSKPSEVAQLYKNLTPQGRSNARVAILAKAAEKAGEEVSPEKFVNELKRLSPSVNVFFQGDELQRVKGLIQAINVTRRAGQAVASPATGARVVPFAAGSLLTSWLGGPVAAGASAGGIGLAARAYESKTVRDMLLRMPKVKGTPEEAALAKRIISALTVQTEEPSK